MAAKALAKPLGRESLGRINSAAPNFESSSHLIGAGIGAAVDATIGHTLPALACGIVLTGLVCHLFRLDDALRPAYAAVIIVTAFGQTTGALWAGPRDSVVAVVLGCLCALAVGVLFDQTSNLFRPARKTPPPGQPGAE